MKNLIKLLVVLALMFSFVAQASITKGFEITVHNTTDKTVYLQYQREDDWKFTFKYKIEPKSSRNIPVMYGEHSVCISFDETIYHCNTIKLTKENMYDKDGHKQYWEISE